MRGIRNGQGIQSAAFKSVIISDRPNRSTRANPLDLSSEHQVHRSKSFKIEQSPKKGSARLSLLARPIGNASVDILKLLEVNSTFARPGRAAFRMVLLSFYLYCKSFFMLEQAWLDPVLAEWALNGLHQLLLAIFP